MNVHYIQSLRHKLRKRVARLNSIEHVVFHHSLRQFWGFLQSHPLFEGILEDLARRCRGARSDAQLVVTLKQPEVSDSELHNAAMAYFVVKLCVESNDTNIETDVGSVYGGGGVNPELNHFRSLFLRPFCDYLDEQLDDQRAILALLTRYKHKCEWFGKQQLYDVWKEQKARGEKHLKAHLFEYLHDQGIDLFIEPKSASGEVDLISDQIGEDRLIAEAKVFSPPPQGKSDIVAGFNQTYTYTRDYNRPFGYLVVYNVSQTELRFTVPCQDQSTPFLVHNGKTIFLLMIDLCPNKPTASKRGPLKVVEISEQDLVRVLEHSSDDQKARENSGCAK